MKNISKFILFNILTLFVLLASNFFAEKYNCEDLVNFKMEGQNLTINKAATIPEGEMKAGRFVLTRHILTIKAREIIKTLQILNVGEFRSSRRHSS